MSKEVSPARQRRRAFGRIFQKMQHAVPGIYLLQEGTHALREGAHGWHFGLAVAEVVTSVVVFIALGRAIRKWRAETKDGGLPHAHHGIDWVDIFLGGMVFTEVWAKYMETGHITRPSILLGVVMILLGLFHGKIAHWRDGKSAN